MTFSGGPLTGVIGTCAAVAGSGLLLGGIAAGVVGVLLAWTPEELEYQVRKAGYWGAAFTLLVLAAEQLMR